MPLGIEQMMELAEEYEKRKNNPEYAERISNIHKKYQVEIKSIINSQYIAGLTGISLGILTSIGSAIVYDSSYSPFLVGYIAMIPSMAFFGLGGLVTGDIIYKVRGKRLCKKIEKETGLKLD